MHFLTYVEQKLVISNQRNLKLVLEVMLDWRTGGLGFTLLTATNQTEPLEQITWRIWVSVSLSIK